MTISLTPWLCAGCGAAIEAATPVNDERATPTPGDLTVCLYCGTILQFDARLRPVAPDRLELALAYRQQPGLKARVEAASYAVKAFRPVPTETRPKHRH